MYKRKSSLPRNCSRFPAKLQEVNRINNEDLRSTAGKWNDKPGRYQRLDLFIKVLSLLWTNLSAAS